MIYPQKPQNEVERLEALATYNIIDTLPEKEYDEITNLASFICNTPISLITFVDEERQFFKSAHGLPQGTTSRNDAFCAYAINTPSQITIVPDARLDKRFKDNPLVTGAPDIVFYAGMPLVTAEGFPLGTICVIDHAPKQLSANQVNALQNLSNQVVKLLELRKAIQLLHIAQVKLEEYAAQMKAFAHLASHDLKEPARMVKSYMTQLQDKYAGQLDEKAKRYIHYASDGANRMGVLIDDLLDYSTVEASGSEKENVNVEQLLTEVVALLSGVINEINATVSWVALPVITAPVIAIKLIFQNLVSNALKYQAKGVQPMVKVTASETDTYWQFDIKDNGIGINEENQEIIFQLFKRLHTKQQYPGTGMGLATCKKIVDMLGGLIWVKSAEGGGSIFSFTIKK